MGSTNYFQLSGSISELGESNRGGGRVLATQPGRREGLQLVMFLQGLVFPKKWKGFQRGFKPQTCSSETIFQTQRLPFHTRKIQNMQIFSQRHNLPPALLEQHRGAPPQATACQPQPTTLQGAVWVRAGLGCLYPSSQALSNLLLAPFPQNPCRSPLKAT